MWITVFVSAIAVAGTLGGVILSNRTQLVRDAREFHRRRAQEQLDRIRAIYAKALRGAQRIQVVALDAGNPLLPGDTVTEREKRLYEDSREGLALLNDAWIELNLENVSVGALDRSPQIGKAYVEFRVRLQEAHPDGSPASFDEVKDLSADLFSVMNQQREAIRAHLAALDTALQEMKH